MTESINRRSLVTRGTLLGAGLFGGAKLAVAAVCKISPTQTTGPFYPVVFPSDTGGDLSHIAGHESSAKGQLVFVEGVIKGTDCRPIAGATVEIWQAAASGKYNDDRDDNPAPRDEDFKGWGRVVTGKDGVYRFKTIKPGAYPTDPNNPNGWIRPPHIHFLVTAPVAPKLVTQLYFAGELLNDKDEILTELRQRVGAARAAEVIVTFSPGGKSPATFLYGKFDISVGRPGDPRATPEID